MLFLFTICATVLFYSVSALDTVLNPRLFPHFSELVNFTSLASSNGYPSEAHTVKTEDGYFIDLFRISGPECEQYNEYPVFILHGLLLSADSWLAAGKGKALAYLFADECYDVWVGNVRGSYYGRRHDYYNPDTDNEFWNFNLDHMAIYDLSAQIDHVLKYTKKTSLNYIGFSQGGTTFFILCSEKEKYNKKINKAVLLAPATRMINTKSLVFRTVSESLKILRSVTKVAGIDEVFYRGSVTQSLASIGCGSDLIDAACDIALSLIDGGTNKYSTETNNNIGNQFPGGTSTENFKAYGQLISSITFVKPRLNTNSHSKETDAQAEYNISAIKVPIAMLFGNMDQIVDKKDVLWASSQVQNLIGVKKVDDDQWAHFDMVYSDQIPELVFKHILEYLNGI